MGICTSVNDLPEDVIDAIIEERIGQEFLLVRHPAKAHHYRLGSFLSDGGKDSTGKTSLISHAGRTIASRLIPKVTHEKFASDLLQSPTEGATITETIRSGQYNRGQYETRNVPVELYVSNESVKFDGRWFNQCRLYSVDAEDFRSWLEGKQLNQKAIGIEGKDRFFIITEAYVAQSVTQVGQNKNHRCVGLLPENEDAGVAARVAHNHANQNVFEQVGKATLAFKFVEVKYDMNGKIEFVNLVPTPKQQYTVQPQTGDMTGDLSDSPSPEPGEYV